ncbi:MAG: hypothetical protein IANPNBLG_04691 [Bryobacteraceae bacterium]|nr:hypothetical protein [Bryobacteraceae bacterium]
MAAAVQAPPSPVELAARAIESFLRSSRQPQLIEPGDPPIALDAGSCQLTTAPRWVTFEAWDKERLLSRRVAAVKHTSPGRLELTTLRFGGKPGSLFLLDASRPRNEGLRRKGHRLVFGEQFRQMLRHSYPGWTIRGLSTEANLEESLSPSFPRALLTKGAAGWAAIAAPPSSNIDAVLAFGLIWLDYLRRRERKLAVHGLAVYLPGGTEQTTILRVRHLNSAAGYAVFTYDEDAPPRQVDLQDCGNVHAHLERRIPPRETLPGPEALLEEQLRSQIALLDARLRPSPVYGQVSATAAADRGILDLLAVDYSGRLAVIELKASESIQLPLQALDYWIRVNRHLAEGDFPKRGYFEDIALHPAPPRLLLAAPATRFHPSNETVLRYFHPDIEVERIGLAHGWGGPVRVLFRHSTMKA